MKNVTELRDELTKVFHELKAGEIQVKTASEMNNTAGKIINSLKVELEYNQLRGEPAAKVPFLEAE